MYLRPRLNYPLPCCTFTPAQCCHIQSLALEGLLPKLHLNRHSPQAVLFTGPLYRGISLPDTLIDQVFGQLSLFIGHLQLNDDVGTMILTLISLLQIHIGSS
jgi:hypothetical protein